MKSNKTFLSRFPNPYDSRSRLNSPKHSLPPFLNFYKKKEPSFNPPKAARKKSAASPLL